MSSELSPRDLELQGAELLPAREALKTTNWADIDATNIAAAVNIASNGASADAAASQLVAVSQD